MIARHARRGALLASFVTLQASLALGAEETTPAEVKPTDVKLEESEPARKAPSSDEATASPPTSADEDGDAEEEAPEKKSPGLEFIKSRRNAVKDAAGEDAPEAVADDASVRRRPERDEPPEPDDGLLGTHQEHFFLGIGPRVGFIDDDGLDPFSTTDTFAQIAIFGGRTLYADGDLSVAAVVEWNYGERSASARGLDAHLGVHRVSLGAEGRYHLIRRLYGYVRLAPGALYTWAKLNQLETDAWALSGDASLGAAFEVFGAKSGETNKPRGWVSLNAGYGFGTETDLTLSPAEGSSSPERTAPLELDALSLTGPFVGGAVALSY